MTAVKSLRRYLVLATLIISGEMIFLLPFVLARVFRPTFLSVFDLTNFELGSAFSLYGVMAMCAYFFGGPLADIFSARKLMSIALLVTSLGGFVLSGIPDLATLTLLYGFWGITTILLFWSALIRATREWGGDNTQGVAYGWLDGGRGLVAALIGSGSVYLFAQMLPSDASTASPEQSAYALSQIIIFFSALTATTGLLVFVILPRNSDAGIKNEGLTLNRLKNTLKLNGIWLHALIIVCAYIGYKCTDDFSLYAKDAFGYDDVEAATIGTVTFWIRPIAAIGAGYLSDKIRSSVTVLLGFTVMVLGSVMIGLGVIQAGMLWFLIMTVAFASLGIYALRGIYFALLQEARIPIMYTGSAVGVISVIGYTPDVFMGPLMGYLIDRSPGAAGHQHVFWFLAIVGVIGFITTLVFRRSTKNVSNN